MIDQQPDQEKQRQRQPAPQAQSLRQSPAAEKGTDEGGCEDQIAGARVEALHHILLVLEATHRLRVNEGQARVGCRSGLGMAFARR